MEKGRELPGHLHRYMDTEPVTWFIQRLRGCKRHLKRCVNCGIAEQVDGWRRWNCSFGVCCVFFSTFFFAAREMRACEIIRNSIGYTNANVKVCATLRGYYSRRKMVRAKWLFRARSWGDSWDARYKPMIL